MCGETFGRVCCCTGVPQRAGRGSPAPPRAHCSLPGPPAAAGIFGFYFYDVSWWQGQRGGALRPGPTAAAAALVLPPAVARSPVPIAPLCTFPPCLQVRHSHQEILNTLFDGLRRLEYRGYDSAGVSVDWPVQAEGEVAPTAKPVVIKAKGKLTSMDCRAFHEQFLSEKKQQEAYNRAVAGRHWAQCEAGRREPSAGHCSGAGAVPLTSLEQQLALTCRPTCLLVESLA